MSAETMEKSGSNRCRLKDLYSGTCLRIFVLEKVFKM